MKLTKIFLHAYHLVMGLLMVTLLSLAISEGTGAAVLFVAAPLLAIMVVQGVASFKHSKARGLAFMAVVAYDPCGATLEADDFTPAADCIEEGSGIVGLIAIKKGFDITTVDDGTKWTAAKTADNVIIISDLEAYWPAANPQTIQGLRGRMDRHGHFQYEMPIKHEGVDANLVFWNTLNQSRNYGVAFVTEEYKVFAALDRELVAIPASFMAVPGSDQEFGKTRFFSGTVKWKSKDLVQFLDQLTPAIVKADFD